MGVCIAVSLAPGTRFTAVIDRIGHQSHNAITRRIFDTPVHYVEIVCDDVDSLPALYQRLHGLSFAPPDPDLGQARVATRSDGTLVDSRKPLAAHEQPIMRTYLAVDEIQKAAQTAEDSSAILAYPPTRQGQRGTFAIVIQGDVQHGLSQPN